MSRPDPRRTVLVPDGPACPNCGGTAWNVGIVAAAVEGEGVSALDLSPAPMARCAACGLSGRLDADRIPWEA